MGSTAVVQNKQNGHGKLRAISSPENSPQKFTLQHNGPSYRIDSVAERKTYL
jgi:hypothetical protein